MDVMLSSADRTAARTFDFYPRPHLKKLGERKGIFEKSIAITTRVNDVHKLPVPQVYSEAYGLALGRKFTWEVNVSFAILHC